MDHTARIDFDPTRRLSDDDMLRGAIVAARLWANEGQFRPNWMAVLNRRRITGEQYELLIKLMPDNE